MLGQKCPWHPSWNASPSSEDVRRGGWGPPLNGEAAWRRWLWGCLAIDKHLWDSGLWGAGALGPHIRVQSPENRWSHDWLGCCALHGAVSCHPSPRV